MTFRHNCSLQIYAAPCPWGLPIFIGKNLWRCLLEVNKEQIPQKSYSLEIWTDSANQILKNKEKVKQTHNINILTRITDRKIPCVYIHVYHITKNQGPGPCNSLRHADNRKYFSGLSLTRNRGKAHMFYLAREVGKIWRLSRWEKGRDSLSWLMNSNMVKPEQFDHFHLVYHFIVPLKTKFIKYRSSRSDVLCKKRVLRNFVKFIGKHLCQSLFFNNQQLY